MDCPGAPSSAWSNPFETESGRVADSANRAKIYIDRGEIAPYQIRAYPREVIPMTDT